MIKWIAPIALVISAHSALAQGFCSCAGFGGIEEYRADINMNNGKASFFDNGTTSYLDRTEVHGQEAVFSGADVSQEGELVLIFNETQLSAFLTSIDEDGHRIFVGDSRCEKTETISDDLK